VDGQWGIAVKAWRHIMVVGLGGVLCAIVVGDASRRPTDGAATPAAGSSAERSPVAAAVEAANRSAARLQGVAEPRSATRGAAVGSKQPDFIAWGSVLASEEAGRSGERSLKSAKLVRVPFKYPLIRVEETVVGAAAAAGRPQVKQVAMVSDHVLVKLRSADMEARLRALNLRYGGTIRKKLRVPATYLIAFRDADLHTVPDRVRAYNGHADVVAYAEPDYLVHICETTPNDPSFGDLWGMPKISAPAAWDLHRGNGNTVVGVIDTGVDHAHEDLAANMWTNTGEVAGNGLDDDGNGFVDDVYGWDFLNEDSNPMDDHSHGTHVAGTIGAEGNNGVGVAGVIWQTRIMAMKFLGADGFGVTSDAVEALAYATMMREEGVPIRLTNNSWGGGGFDQTLKDAVAAGGVAGMLFIAAAGNDAADNDQFPHYPSSLTLTNVISVANTDTGDALDGSSNYGAVSVDLAAPGSLIKSTTPGNTYGYKTGTSMASPHVAGAAALLWDSAPDMTWQEVRQALLAGVDLVSALSGKTVSGGRLNVAEALLQLRPAIGHTPLMNTTNDTEPYLVDATMAPGALLDTNRLWCFWNTDGHTNTFSSNAAVRVAGDLYRAEIPAQSLGTAVHYYLWAETLTGLVAVDPANAPSSLHSFSVTEPTTLWITGRPGEIGSVVPDYGVHQVASGSTVNATAELHVLETNGHRYTCTGWSGMGDAPPAGTTNTVSFQINQMSAVEWQWEAQVSLVHSSTPPGVLDGVTWWPVSSTGETLAAAQNATLGGTNHQFVEWRVDGARQPDATNVAVNPVTGLLMNTSRVAVAVYMPEDVDSDEDSLPDWWEFHHFGSLSLSQYDDPDGDLYLNQEEFQDRSNPRDPLSIPSGPTVAHTPLADPQVGPAPWTVTATVSDEAGVSGVALRWRRNELGERLTAMQTNGIPGEYSGVISEPGILGDTFEYTLEATDGAGYSTDVGPHSFFVSYPVSTVSPTDVSRVLLVGTSTNVTIYMTNSGNAGLTWSADLVPVGILDDMESGAGGWVHGGQNDLWHLTESRAYSLTHSWYCGVSVYTQYIDSMDARLVTPPVRLAPGARLSFRHWARMELEYGNYAWDGGIVELSTDGGSTYSQITPEGGYPYLIVDNPASPFVPDTPCFAGTGGWESASFDLSTYAGEEVRFRFRFGSDGWIVEEGWYIDDVVVTPRSMTNGWATLAAAGGVLDPSQATNLTLQLDSASVPTGRDEFAVLRIVSNDPLAPTNAVELLLRVRSVPVTILESASQTSTNGEGYVTVGNTVFDADGEPCELEVLYSLDLGQSWQNAWVDSAAAGLGGTTISNGAPAQVTGIATTNAVGPASNQVTIVWDTTNSTPVVHLVSNVLVGLRAWDGLFWSASVTSQPFSVDNEAPSAPVSLQVTSHVPEVWSADNVVALEWGAAGDGAGSGVAGYGVHVTEDPETDLPGMLVVTGLQTAVPVAPGGTNWWVCVRAFDRFGNGGAATNAGPLWIDATPPDASATVIAVLTGPYGDYICGTSATSSWSGFTDSLSGISNYFYSLADNGGTTNGAATTGSTGVLAGLIPDQTNHVYVWARDNVGLIGAAAGEPILVLAEFGDFDGDGLLTGEEETAGTDATDPASVFMVGPTTTEAPTNGLLIVIQWDSVVGRLYNLYSKSSLSDTNGTWQPVPSHTNLPGTGETMSYTGAVAGVDTLFHRITVRRE